ncbi:Spindle pole body interacting protein [Apiospora hydei]|uniref:Spindle pole body interacting protein n=1 Tax=Apiospora hydei TaxID=1337664 RepID=A0ABR1X028_9PEZI
MTSIHGSLPQHTRITTTQSHSNGQPGAANPRASLSSFPPSRSASQMSHSSRPARSPQPPIAADTDRTSDPSSKSNKRSSAGSRTGASSQHSSLSAPKRYNPDAQSPRRLRSQYPRGSIDNHVEYILVASFDIDRGPVMEHQYPVAITGDEHMLAELMLPDQAHVRNQDWTIFFLHKDTSQEEDEEDAKAKAERRRRRKRRKDRAAGLIPDHDDQEPDEDSEEDDDNDDDEWDDESTDSEPEGGEGPLDLRPKLGQHEAGQDGKERCGSEGHGYMYTASLPAHLQGMALRLVYPLLLLALEEYFKSPVPETLAMLYDAVNGMDLSLMPKLSLLERHLLLASDNKDLFVEKFAQMIEMRMAEDQKELLSQPIESSKGTPKAQEISRAGTRAHLQGSPGYSIPRDTHEFESKVLYKGIPIPVKVPTAVMPETVGDFSLIKLIQTFSDPHAKSPQPFPVHPHLTTNGPNTHPVIVLANALLTQKRIIFLGHNMPSGDVAEAVLAACALASGGLLRGFTRHAFPYTDLTKIDDLLKVPGFIAGVTNPTFENHPEWWDLLCDIPSGRMKISSKIENTPITEGLIYFQQQNPSFANLLGGASTTANTDLTGDMVFMGDILKSIVARRGERAIRAKWRDWVLKFTRIAAAFEESVYGASALYIGGDEFEHVAGAGGHGYVWADDAAKQKELAGNVCRIEGWRNTRSYYSYIQDLAQDAKLNPTQSREVYLAFAKYVHSYDEICLLLTVAPESHAGLFYLALGLFHKDRDVRVKTTHLLERVSDHMGGQHWWRGLSRFEKLAYHRIKKEAEAEMKLKLEKEGVGPRS